MEDKRRLDYLSKRLDVLDRDYSSTIAELQVNVHSLMYKINKDNQLEYEQKQNDIECKKVQDMKDISSKDFAFRLILSFLVGFGALSIFACLLKFLFF